MSRDRVKHLAPGLRVAVSNDPPSDLAALAGLSGTVVRTRINDDGAWVKMDERRPGFAWAFPEDDERGRNALLYPEDCIEVQP